MKKIIIILGTIILGIWMVSALITDENDGLAGQADSVVKEASNRIDELKTISVSE